MLEPKTRMPSSSAFFFEARRASVSSEGPSRRFQESPRGFRDLGGGGAASGDVRAVEDGDGLFFRRGDAHEEEAFLFAAAHGEHAVRGRLRERFLPLEVVAEFRAFLLLALHDFQELITPSFQVVRAALRRGSRRRRKSFPRGCHGLPASAALVSKTRFSSGASAAVTNFSASPAAVGVLVRENPLRERREAPFSTWR